MMLLVFSVVSIALLAYILFVSFSEAAALLPSDSGMVMSPLSTMPKSPQEWLSRYISDIGHRGFAMGSPTAEVRNHEWLSLVQYPVSDGYTTFYRNTNPRKLF